MEPRVSEISSDDGTGRDLRRMTRVVESRAAEVLASSIQLMSAGSTEVSTSPGRASWTQAIRDITTSGPEAWTASAQLRTDAIDTAARREGADRISVPETPRKKIPHASFMTSLSRALMPFLTE